MKHLTLFNEHFEEQLCRYIGDDEYQSWKSREYIKLDKKSISIFKEQIIKFLDRYNQNFDESKMYYIHNRITYNGNPLYGPPYNPTGEDEYKLIISCRS